MMIGKTYFAAANIASIAWGFSRTMLIPRLEYTTLSITSTMASTRSLSSLGAHDKENRTET